MALPAQHVQRLGLQVVLLPEAHLLLVVPPLLLALEDHGGDGGEGLVVCGGAELVGLQGAGEGGVVVAQGEEGLREVVVCFHGGGGQGEAGLAVGHDGVPVAELEAGHGAVGVEGWVLGVCYYAVWAFFCQERNVHVYMCVLS